MASHSFRLLLGSFDLAFAVASSPKRFGSRVRPDGARGS
jgi:hypothetical protein